VGTIEPERPGPGLARREYGGGRTNLRQATEHYQRQLISACLERHQHNWASAARELGLDRANLGRMAKR